MRKSIDGLCAIVQQSFQMNPFQKSLFLFSGRKHDRLKALYWEGDGFLLLYKRRKVENSNGLKMHKQSALSLYKNFAGS
jgi:transposase